MQFNLNDIDQVQDVTNFTHGKKTTLFLGIRCKMRCFNVHTYALRWYAIMSIVNGVRYVYIYGVRWKKFTYMA